MRRTGFLYDKRFLRHHTGTYHPEIPERLTAIMEGLEADGFLSRLVSLSPPTPERRWVEAVHEARYIRRFETACRDGQRVFDSPDNQMGPETFGIALLAAAGVVEAARRMMAGEIDNAFCAVRPPGHHAETGRAMGFCYFNNVAVAARYLQAEWGVTAGGHRGFRRAPRKRHPADFRARFDGVLLFRARAPQFRLSRNRPGI